MSIESQLGEELKAAMKAKQTDLLACIRQLKSKVQETVNAEGFSGPVDDALYQKVIASYIKSLEKGIGELAGERGQALRDKYHAEITYLKKYLPEMLSEDKTREVVKKAIADAAATTAAQAGKVMGLIMKEYKGKVDSAMAKKMVDQLLGQ